LGRRDCTPNVSDSDTIKDRPIASFEFCHAQESTTLALRAVVRCSCREPKCGRGSIYPLSLGMPSVFSSTQSEARACLLSTASGHEVGRPFDGRLRARSAFSLAELQIELGWRFYSDEAMRNSVFSGDAKSVLATRGKTTILEKRRISFATRTKRCEPHRKRPQAGRLQCSCNQKEGTRLPLPASLWQPHTSRPSEGPESGNSTSPPTSGRPCCGTSRRSCGHPRS
jgi:hypothetical protein